MNKKNAGLFSRKSIITAFTISLAYLLVSFLLIGFKTDQLGLTAFFLVCFFSSSISRKFITGFAIFIAYWIIFDYMKAFPNYTVSRVHIGDLYNAEKSLFGFSYLGNTITPNEYWQLNGRTWLDILTGIFYLCWIPVPLALAAYFFFKDKTMFLHFSLTFVLVNMIGFIVYYIYPAAPPWYYHLNGDHFFAHTPGNTAGLHKFDDFFHAGIFRSLYAKSSNVFGAMPSLHCSYPVIVLYYGIKKKFGWVNFFFLLVMLGIWFSAVYSSHHYVLDLLAGIICAIAGIFFFEKILLRSARVNRFLNLYRAAI